MNQQQILDKTMQMAYRQGRKSMKQVNADDYERCLLRSETGAKCFIGMHIDDGDYMEDMEMHNVMRGLPKTFNIDDVHAQNTEKFWFDLLAIHDHTDVADWPVMFQGFAIQHGLVINVIEPVEWIRDHEC